MEKKFDKKYLLLLIPPVIIILDLLSKWAIMSMEPLPYAHRVLGNFLRWSFTYNEGITFGMFNSDGTGIAPYILTGLGLIALSLVVYLFFNIDKLLKGDIPQKLGRIAMMLVVGGALGNMIDRLFLFNNPNIPNHHAVVDFIDVGIKDARFYIFNVADSCIVVGAIGLGILFLLFEEKFEKKKKKEISE